jgi:transcriptional regulator with GAF, ATPase, and Fis domain
MSSLTISTPEDASLSRPGPASPRLGESVHHRLELMRELTLSLLTELESMGRPEPAPDSSLSLDEQVKQFEITLIRAALDKARGNQAKAARMLGVKHTTLNAKIKRYQIQEAGHEIDFRREGHEMVA